MRIAILGDTHLPRGRRRLPNLAVELIREADLALHTGDWMRAEVIDEIASLGTPLRGVHGNVDDAAVRTRMPQTLELDADGVRIAIVHDAGGSAGRVERLRTRFPGAGVVLFGHSHIPLHARSADGAFEIFNPGSATDRRRQPNHTMGVAEIAGGRIELRHVDLG